jgi:tetratricopeptide (TPR) repeat protein
LAVALIAAAVLNVLLLISFGWSELIGPGWRSALWAMLAAGWAAAALWSARLARRDATATETASAGDAYGHGLDHYLKGDYYQAERVFAALLRENPRDIDARLMLATLWRRTGRLDEAAEQLGLLRRTEGGEKWALEIEDEQEKLNVRAIHRPCPQSDATGQSGGTALQS